MSSLAKVCSMACTLDYVESQKAVKADKEHRERKSKFLDNDSSFQKAKAQKAFNEFIRLRDAKDGCISCDKPADWNGQWHAGHYKTVGARPDLRFSELNCHKQCSKCNNYLSGNLADYKEKLISKIGRESVEALAFVTAPIKFTASDYKAIHKIYSDKIKELKNAKS